LPAFNYDIEVNLVLAGCQNDLFVFNPNLKVKVMDNTSVSNAVSTEGVTSVRERFSTAYGLVFTQERARRKRLTERLTSAHSDRIGALNQRFYGGKIPPYSPHAARYASYSSALDRIRNRHSGRVLLVDGNFQDALHRLGEVVARFADLSVDEAELDVDAAIQSLHDVYATPRHVIRWDDLED
jgi:hypothetical protein